MKVEEEFRDDEGSSAETISSEGEGVSDTHGHRDDVTPNKRSSSTSAFSLGKLVTLGWYYGYLLDVFDSMNQCTRSNNKTEN